MKVKKVHVSRANYSKMNWSGEGRKNNKEESIKQIIEENKLD